MPAGLRWLGHAFRIGSWRRDPQDGGWWADIASAGTAELFAATPAPSSRLPLHQVENIVRATYLAQSGQPGPAATEFRAELVEWGIAKPDSAGWVHGSADRTQWTGLAGDGQVTLRMYQPGFQPLRRS